MDPESAVRTHPVRRVVRLCLLSLFLGLVTSWLVAWGIGVWAPFKYVYRAAEEKEFEGGGAQAYLRHKRANGIDYLVVMLGLSPDEAEPHVPYLEELLRLDFVPSWSRAHQCWSAGQPVPAEAIDPAHDPSLGGIWQEAAFGWPLPALRAVFRPRPLDGFTPPQWLPGQRDGNPHPCLPYKPVWSGLLIDTAAFAGAWLVTGSVCGAARRRWRVSRGHCPCCGYDLLGIEGTCPECGRGRLPESSPYRGREASRPERRSRKRLVRTVASVLAVLIALLIGWAVKVATEPPPDWTPLRENVRSFLLQATDDPAITSYIDEHFDGAADSTEQWHSEKRSRWKEMDLRTYLQSVEAKIAIEAHNEGRMDVFEFLADYPRPDPE